MNFPNKYQSINTYLSKFYSKLTADSAVMVEWSTFKSSCDLETRRLALYAVAIKEEIKDELNSSPAYLKLDEAEKQQLIASIERIHQSLSIPTFQPEREACVENAAPIQASIPAASRPPSASYRNAGMPTGAIIGIGVGLLISKSVPALVIGGIGGLVAGSLIVRAVGSGGSKQIPHVQVRPAAAAQPRLSLRKVEALISKRHQTIGSLFRGYLQQLEEACELIVSN